MFSGHGIKPAITLSAAVLFGTLATTPAEAERGRPYIDTARGTLVTDTGELLRGVWRQTDADDRPLDQHGNDIGLIPSVTQMTQASRYGFNALHVYAEAPYCPSYSLPSNQASPAQWAALAGSRLNSVKSIVARAKTADLYVMITIGHGCDGYQVPVSAENFQKDFAISFWQKYASEFADDEHVIFELSNEPYFTNGGNGVFSMPSPSTTLDLMAETYKAARTAAPSTPILLFSYGSVKSTNANNGDSSAAIIADWNAVDDRLINVHSFPALNPALDAIAFHTYDSGSGVNYQNLTEVRTTLNGVRADGKAVINTEQIRGEAVADCHLPNFTAQVGLCLRPEQVLFHEEEEISWLSFLQLGADVARNTFPAYPYGVNQKVVPQMNYGVDGTSITWANDTPNAWYPAKLASPACGSTVTFKSQYNSKYLSTHGNQQAPVLVDVSSPGSQEQFEVVCHGGKIALRSAATGNKYLNPTYTSTTNPVRNNANLAGNILFDWLVKPNGKVALRALHGTSARPGWRFLSLDTSTLKLFDDSTTVQNARSLFTVQ